MDEHNLKNQKPEGVFKAMPPKFAFWAGFVSAIAISAIIGLAVVLFMVYGNANNSTTPTNTNTNSAANTNTNKEDAPAVPEGTIDLNSLANVKGTGDVTVITYSDFECPYCKRFHTAMTEAMKKYEGKVKWAYKNFPLTSIHADAQPAAEAVECATEQGKFWEMADKLFGADTLSAEAYQAMADELGLNRTNFDACVSSHKYKDNITKDTTEGQKYGATGTPYSLVLDKDGKIVDVIAGAYPLDNTTDPTISISYILEQQLK